MRCWHGQPPAPSSSSIAMNAVVVPVPTATARRFGVRIRRLSEHRRAPDADYFRCVSRAHRRRHRADAAELGRSLDRADRAAPRLRCAATANCRKLALQELRVAVCRCVRVAEPTEQVLRPEYLSPQSTAPASVGCRQVEQREYPRHCMIGTFGVPLSQCTDRPAYFASHIGHLFDERLRVPSSCREIAVHWRGVSRRDQSIN